MRGGGDNAAVRTFALIVDQLEAAVHLKEWKVSSHKERHVDYSLSLTKSSKFHYDSVHS